MKRKIAFLVAVFFLCATLAVPTLSYAGACTSCCAVCEDTAVNYPIITIEMLLNGVEGYDPWVCMAMAYSAGLLCCGVLGCQNPAAAAACIGFAIFTWAQCVDNELAQCKADCPCCGGCPE